MVESPLESASNHIADPPGQFTRIVFATGETNMTAGLEKKQGIQLYSPAFFGACSVGGALSCGLTHTLVTPLDLVKCRRQVSRLPFGKGDLCWCLFVEG